MNDTATATFEQERGRLTSLAYRMLGERAAAEDVVQNAWLRWARIDETEIKTPAAWLTTVTTRLAIDVLKSARHKREVYAGIWLPEPILSEAEAPATPEDSLSEAQDVQLALLWAMERLGPEERAAFILREAFDYPHDEIAEVLDIRPAHARKLAPRARSRTSKAVPPQTPNSDMAMRLAQAFSTASREGDLGPLERLLHDDVVLNSDGGGKVLAALNPIHGRDNVIRFLLGIDRKSGGIIGIEVTEVAGAAGFVLTEAGRISAVIALTQHGDALSRIDIVRNPDKLPGRGLDYKPDTSPTT